jgi:flagellar biosynthesis protein FlhG
MQSETLFREDGTASPKVIAFASPKGGLGTSVLVANLGIQLAKKGKTVLLLDLALTEASLHLAVGMPRPDRHLGSLVSRQVAELKDAAVFTPVAGLNLVAGAPEIADVANMAYLLKQKIIHALPSLPYEYVLVDAGAGTASDTLDFLLASTWIVLVCQATATTLETFYRFKVALLHRLLQDSLSKKRYQALSAGINPASPLEGLWDHPETHQEDLDAVEAAIRSRRFSFVLTGLQSEKDARVGHQVEALVRRHFLLPLRYLGGVEWDIQAAAASRSLEAIAKAHPMCPFSMATERLANIVLKEDREPRPAEGHLNPRPLQELDAYQALESPFNATPKEIQAAYLRLLDPYLETSILTTGLYTRETREAVRDRLEWAYKLLINSRERQRYDDDLVARGAMAPEQRVQEYRDAHGEGLLPPSPPDPSTASGQDDVAMRKSRQKAALATVLEEVQSFNGPGLKRIREALNISVEEIVSVTNIRSWYITSIEEERFDALPAPLYVKGFVRQIAQYLGLDSNRVLTDYLENYQHWRQRHPE